eukprot:m.215362 g.215362  ORF g.215362 m.215362 type:complete len:381 (-) comp25613_c1_seq2:209-1351(-)
MGRSGHLRVEITTTLLCCILHLDTTSAAAVPPRLAPLSCGDNAALSKSHCICTPGFECAGSTCSHVTQIAGMPDGTRMNLPHGFRMTGPHRCSNCACVAPSTRATHYPTTLPSGGGAASAVPTRDAGKISKRKLRMFAGIKSGTSKTYQTRRKVWRESGCAEIYEKANIGYKFFIGVPLEKNHVLTHHQQGKHDTVHERELEKLLLDEAVKEGDVELLPLRDQYMDLTNKLLQIFRYGYYQTDADYVIEHDDEFCMKATVALETVAGYEEAKTSEVGLYAGTRLWQGTESNNMKGPDGGRAPFFSGWCSFLSRSLLEYILVNDWAHTVMVGHYGTSSDDGNTGRWVQHLQKVHSVKVAYVEKKMITKIEDMPKVDIPLVD